MADFSRSLLEFQRHFSDDAACAAYLAQARWPDGFVHVQSYLDEFVLRFNRRRTRHAAFRSLLGIGARIKPVTYQMSISPESAG